MAVFNLYLNCTIQVVDNRLIISSGELNEHICIHP